MRADVATGFQSIFWMFGSSGVLVKNHTMSNTGTRMTAKDRNMSLMPALGLGATLQIVADASRGVASADQPTMSSIRLVTSAATGERSDLVRVTWPNRSCPRSLSMTAATPS